MVDRVPRAAVCAHNNNPPPRLHAAAASLGDVSTPLGKAVRILNNQLQALTQVEARTDELGSRLAQLRAGS